jgi:predicted GNAT family acetyltransferase
LQRIFTNEQMLVAELNGRLVGKINTSADSFTRFQVGGVYVHPDFRAQGIALRMTAEFVRSLIAQGKGVSLFVKKSNPAALSVYRRAGFEFLADYRISYY